PYTPRFRSSRTRRSRPLLGGRALRRLRGRGGRRTRGRLRGRRSGLRRLGRLGSLGLGGGGLLLSRLLLGSLLGRRGRVLSNLADDGGLDGRRRRPHDLSLLLQVGEERLALDPELLGELIDPDLGHISPSLSPRSGPAGDRD